MIINKSNGKLLDKNPKWLNNVFSQSLGAMFRKKISRALIFPLKKEARASASIHMFFVFTPLTVLWVNSEKIVVDKGLAKPFRTYTPTDDAKYVIELPPSAFNKVKIGDYLDF
jgi:uncharacterized membrane protein (UPF0127 family)